jgi:hypothetical protein
VARHLGAHPGAASQSFLWRELQRKAIDIDMDLKQAEQGRINRLKQEGETNLLEIRRAE